MDKDINYLFNEMPLYTKETFTVFNYTNEQYVLDKEELDKFLCLIGFNQDKLITKCHKCKKEFPFNIDQELYKLIENYKSNIYNIDITQDVTSDGPGRTKYITCGKIDVTNGNIEGIQPPYSKEILLNGTIHYLEYYFSCTNNYSHNYTMLISIEFNNGKFVVRKVGQNPSMLTVKGFEFDKYRKFLEKIDAYDDYKKADFSYADHFYAGAYTYLRRIFEKMINYYLGNSKLEDNHMDTKIKAVKDKFDPRINHLLKQLYDILSVSIHELSEEQSKEYYEYLKAIIDIQLEYIKTEADKDHQSKSLSSVLSKITNLVKR